VDAGVEQLLHETQVGITSDEARLESIDPLRTADAGDDAFRPPELQWLGLAFDGVLTGVRVGNRRRGRTPGVLVDEDRSRLGHRLSARRRVDAVTHDDALTGRVDGGDRPGCDAAAGL